MTKVYLSIGTNLGNKIENIDFALVNIQHKIGVISTISSVYQSEAWGYDSENIFYNIALELNTNLKPEEILLACQNIEKEAGRIFKKNAEYSDRILDIDILYFNDLTINTENLQIPHPKRLARLFVLVPMTEIASNFIDVEKNARIQDLLLNCPDKTNVEKLSIELNWKIKMHNE